MALEIFINFGPQIWGGTKDPIQRKTHDSDVLAYRWGVTGPATHAGEPGSLTFDRPNVNELHLTKHADSASEKLVKSLEENEPIPKCVLVVRRSGGGHTTLMRAIMEHCWVREYDGRNARGPAGTEEVTIHFSKLRTEQSG